MMVTMGARQSMGLFIGPIDASLGLGITTISLALAIGQFTWGAIQPIAGALADRFGPGAPAIDRFAFLPFGAGPRICIGANFALQEAAIILATLLARLRVETVPGRTPRPRMILTLRPEGGAWLRVTPR